MKSKNIFVKVKHVLNLLVIIKIHIHDRYEKPHCFLLLTYVCFKIHLPTYSLPPSHNRIRFKSEYEIEDISRPIYLKSYETKEEISDSEEQSKTDKS